MVVSIAPYIRSAGGGGDYRVDLERMESGTNSLLVGEEILIHGTRQRSSYRRSGILI